MLDEIQKYREKFKTCTTVFYTCVLGGYDRLFLPRVQPSLGSCHVAFLDRISLKVMKGRHANVSNYWHFWHLEIISDPFLGDNLLTQKSLKLLPHLIFPNARRTLWFDGKMRLRMDPYIMLQRLFIGSQGFAAFAHPRRQSVKEEFLTLFRLARNDCKAMVDQYRKYYVGGKFPDDNVLLEGAVLFRNHSAKVLEEFSCMWFAEVAAMSRRDQLSLPWVLSRLKAKGPSFLTKIPFSERMKYFKRQNHLKKRSAHSDGRKEICKQQFQQMLVSQ